MEGRSNARVNVGAGGREATPLSGVLPSNVMRRQDSNVVNLAERPLTKPTMNSNYTTTNRDSLIQMFLDGTSGEVHGEGRLVTQDEGEGVTSLIAYGWNKVAEYDESTDTVTLFAGHAGNISKTVTRYVNLVHEMAGKRETRTVNVLADAAPNVGRPPAEAAQFIGNYKSFSGSDSSVEEWATATVDRAVRSML